MSEAVLDAVPQTAVPAAGEVARTNRGSRRCPECLAAFGAVQPGQLFCCREHKRAYNNRWLKRGAVIAPLYAAAWQTRDGTRGDKATGKRARQDSRQLIQRWKDEDAAAGRMSVVDYMAARYRLGLVEVA
ncbi:MAG TPA: hypothetical protein VGF77_08275 [Allosphingosinicella sp.]|jgi:hypothetical protein